MSTPFLLGLLVLGGLSFWFLRARSARDSKRAAAATKARNEALRSAKSVQAALRGRR